MSSEAKKNYQNYISLVKQRGTRKNRVTTGKQVTIFIGYRKNHDFNVWRLIKIKRGKNKLKRKIYFRQCFGMKQTTK